MVLLSLPKLPPITCGEQPGHGTSFWILYSLIIYLKYDSSMKFDRIDLDILDALQKDGTLSATDLAAQVGLSQSPCWRRVRLLEEGGVIKRRVALLSREQLGLEVLVFVHVKLTSNGWQTLPRFKQRVVSFPEVIQCFVLMGDIDFILLVATRTIDEYNTFVQKKLAQVPGVHSIDSRIVLEETKNTTELPIRELRS